MKLIIDIPKEIERNEMIDMVLEIIDKHIAESEE